MSQYTSSLAYVRDAIRDLPDVLRRSLKVPLPKISTRPKDIVTTGIGASEGPARMLAHGLAEAGCAARFCPVSQVGLGTASAELLVVFSQGLSPNAHLALRAAKRFKQRWLVTSVDRATAAPPTCDALNAFVAHGFTALVVPPDNEPQSLARMIGPTTATLFALRLTAHLLVDDDLTKRLTNAPNAYHYSREFAPVDASRIGIVTIGLAAEEAYAHRWKLLEALLGSDPPVWDVLQFAHGPLQAFHGQQLSLLVLERGSGSPLLSRLHDTLARSQHRVIHLPTMHADQLAFFEHAAFIDALLLSTLKAHPRDLFNWPARNGDAPLYNLGGERSST